MSERVLREPSGGADNDRVNAAAELKQVFSLQDLLNIRTGEKVVGGAGLAGTVSPAKFFRFLRLVPAEEETTRPGRTLQKRDELW